MYEIRFLRALGLTIGIETLTLLLAARNPWKPFLPPLDIKTILIAGLIGSGLTLPYVWFVWPALIENFFLYAVVAEAFAIGVETGILSVILRIPPGTAFGLSLVCNVCSVGLGRLLRG